MAIAQDVIAKSGSWFSFEDARIGQGRENVKAKLEEDKELLDRIFEALKRLPQLKSVSQFSRNTRVTVLRVEIGESQRIRNIHITLSDRNQSGKAVMSFIN
jgi:predicted regulator of amino acid metabolism with ACT domain